MKKPPILITGQNGQLGNELKVLSGEFPTLNFIFTDAKELNIADADQVHKFFNDHSPAVCINAAAYTAVDKAETERELAYRINAEGVGNLAANCAKVGGRLIHVSTDYVFDGRGTSPYTEDHVVSPVNYYGESKLRGEQMAIEKLPGTVVIRTSWVYSFFGNNFVKTMLRLMRERESINVINDQFGSPTYAADLAAVIMHIVSSKTFPAGVYHYSNEGIISWYDFAVAIHNIAELNCIVKPITTADYPTPAKRPAYSAMDKEKIKSLGIELKPWKESLRHCITLLLQK